MDIWDGLRIVLRRWKVAVPIFLAFVLVAFVGSGTIAGEYTANASVILLGPNQQSATDALDPSVGQTDVNAYLRPCNTCETVARAIQLTVHGSETKQLMVEDGLSTDYKVGVEDGSPIMAIEASSASPGGAVDTLEGVVERVTQELESRQTDVNAPTDQRITANVLSQDQSASGSFTGRMRMRLALSAVGAAVAVAAAFVVEGTVFTRSRRRGPSPDDTPDDNASHLAQHGHRPPAPGAYPSNGGYGPPTPGTESRAPNGGYGPVPVDTSRRGAYYGDGAPTRGGR